MVPACARGKGTMSKFLEEKKGDEISLQRETKCQDRTIKGEKLRSGTNGLLKCRTEGS